MTTSIRRNSAVLLALCLAFAAIASLSLGAAFAEGVHFQKESLKTYEGQLSKGEVHALAFHPGEPSGHLHISLNDGRHMTVAYKGSEQAKLVAQAQAKGARVQIATAKAKPAAAVKHKLRYIAAGILVAVILIVLIVLLVGRRRTLAAQAGGGAPSEESAAP